MAAILLPYNTNSTIYFPLVGSGTAAFSTAGTGSLVGTNIQVSKDGGAFATSTNTGTHLASGYYRLVLTTSELSAKQVAIYIGIGTLGTVVEHQAVFIHTYGSASAMYGFDFGTMLSSQTVGTVTTVLGGTIGTVTGTPLVNLVPNQSTATIGTVFNVLTAVTMTGTPAVDVALWKGTAAAGTQGTVLVNLVANQSGATIGTVVQVTNAVTVTGTPVVDLTKILGTGAVATAGTFTNIGTAGTVLGTQLSNLVANQATATIGTVLTYNGVASANLVQILGTAAVATAGTLTNIGTAGTALGTLNANAVALKGTAISGTQGTIVANIGAATLAELAQGQPSATPSVPDALMALYMALRNAGSMDGTSKTFANSAGTVVFKKAVSATGTLYTEGSATSGP